MRKSNKPLRVCIYDYFKQTEGNIIGECIQAKIESGIIKEKDQLLLMPLGHMVTIKGIEISKRKVQVALPGDLCEIALTIPPALDPNYIRPGNVLCDQRYPIH
jgi:translation elongation factor EF-1alpha